MNKIICLSLALLLVACGGDKQAPTADKVGEFAVATVRNSSIDLNTTYPATVRGAQDVEIRAKVTGHIVKQHVDEGAQVVAGQVLFTIDPTQYQAAVQQAQAQVKVVRANIATQQLTLQNKKMLRERDIVSQYDLDVASNQLGVLQAQLEQAQAALKNAKDQLSFCTVRATSSGVISTIPYRVGSLVSPSTPQPLTVVSNLKQMHVYFSMTEKQLLEMSRNNGGTKAAVAQMPEVDLVLADGTTYERKGKVSSVSGLIDPSTGSVKMRATFDNPNAVLRSGATGTLRFPLHHSNAIVIVQSATFEIQDKKFVYVLGKGNKVQSREVSVLPQNNGKDFVVTAGLRVGERIVVEGVNKLKNDMEIKPVSQADSEQQYEKSKKHLKDKAMPQP